MEKSKTFAGYCSYVKPQYAYDDNPKSYSFNGPKSRGDDFGTSGDPDMNRKKRVASYNMYAMESKLKSSFQKSCKWIKSKLTGDYFDG